MHHKRRRAKQQRAGSLWFKMHKRGGQAKTTRVKGLKAPRKLRTLEADHETSITPEDER